MRTRLAELAKTSAVLRRAVLEKKSGLLGNALSFVGKKVLQHPLGTAVGAASVVGGVQGARGKYKEYKSGFDPNVQRAMLGGVPTPGGE